MNLLRAGLFWQVLMLLSGCTTPPTGPPPIGPNLNGTKWQGLYFSTDGKTRESITASIEHQGEMVRVMTSRTELPGRLFMGVINANGDLYAVDAADGRRWTSQFGSVTSKNLKLTVFERPPEAGKSDPPLLVVDLYR